MKLRCRDDTVPKTVDTRSHCKVWLRACNNLPQPPPYISVFWGCGRLLHALNHTLQWLLVSTVFGTVSSLHLNFIFNDFYTCIYSIRWSWKSPGKQVQALDTTIEKVKKELVTDLLKLWSRNAQAKIALSGKIKRVRIITPVHVYIQ